MSRDRWRIPLSSPSPNLHHVWFEPQEMLHVSNVAREQIRQNRQVGARPKYGAVTGKKGDDLHWIGAKGEKAVSLWLDLPWTDPTGSWGQIDVGGKVEVRASSIDLRRRDLIIHPKDRNHAPFVAVLATEDPTDNFAALLGWAWGHEAKDEAYWKDPSKSGRWAFFVPLKNLRPMEALLPFLHPLPHLHDWIAEKGREELWNCVRCGGRAVKPDREVVCPGRQGPTGGATGGGNG